MLRLPKGTTTRHKHDSNTNSTRAALNLAHKAVLWFIGVGVTVGGSLALYDYVSSLPGMMYIK